MTTALILNLIFATAIVATIVSLLAWAIATQFRDHPRRAVAKARERTPRAPAGHFRPVHSPAHRIHAQEHGIA